MNAVHELAEKIEHVAHSEHPGGHGGHGGPDQPKGKASGRVVGITMAVLGVMLAFCSAQVGAQRTELMRAMVMQSTKFGFYQGETTKFRVISADLELLKSISPKPDEIKKVEDTLRTKRGAAGKGDDEDTAEVKELIASATEDMADLLTPDPEEITRFGKMSRSYKRDMLEAKEDAEAYEGVIDAHHESAERFELAQLAAEVGIVVASIALLLSSQFMWIAAVVLGLGCAGTLGFTFVETERALSAADAKIKAASDNVIQLENDDTDPASGGAAPSDPGRTPSPAAPAPK
ncbi:MAG TPA: DUF4337 family protein [Polyangiaceae bacterium]|jgi:hypothetical protein|nr:DUF4337 family protein [Polyangiaceae bacterium]